MPTAVALGGPGTEEALATYAKLAAALARADAPETTATVAGLDAWLCAA